MRLKMPSKGTLVSANGFSIVRNPARDCLINFDHGGSNAVSFGNKSTNQVVSVGRMKLTQIQSHYKT